MYPVYEADVLGVCLGDAYVAAYGPVNWLSLNPKIKTVLVDLAFTDQLTQSYRTHREIRKKLLPHVSKDDLFGFIQAIKDWKSWELFKDKEKAQKLWEDRFYKRIQHLEAEEIQEDRNCLAPFTIPIPLILPTTYPMQPFHSLSSAPPFPLPVLEPASAAGPAYEFITVNGKEVLSGIASDVIKSTNIIPEMIQMTQEVLSDGTRKITDIFFPILKNPGVIRGAGSEEITKTVEVAFPGEDFQKIKKGMRFRYEKRNAPLDTRYEYVHITKVYPDGKLDLAEPINLAELATGRFQVDSNFFLPLNKINLSGLLANKLPSIDITLSSPMGKVDFQKLVHVENGEYQLPILMDIFIPKLKQGGEKEYQHFSFLMNLVLKKKRGNWRLKSTKLFLSIRLCCITSFNG